MATKKAKEERKSFYYGEGTDKPIYAGGILLVRNNKKEVLVQRLPKENGFIYTDFGGKIDFIDKNIHDTIIRELVEEINYGIFNKEDNEYLDEITIREFIEKNILQQFYIPTAKYLLLFVNFDESKLGLDMSKIGNKEELDKIERTVEWITSEEFINSHFEHHLHPRIWGKNILEFMGYDGHHHIQEEIIVKKLTKFAFK